ncbi:perilipin-4-like [Penaeus vannamei]|uniref:perilipin-4-like n=1 Tax=Penaeus vannamei TaxID=6689 RepID=UPI00387F746B
MKLFLLLVCVGAASAVALEPRPLIILEPINSLVSEAVGAVTDIVGGVVGLATGVAGGAVDLATDAAGGAVDLVTDVAGGAVDLATDAAGGAVDLATDVAGGAVELATDAAGGAVVIATDVAGGVVNIATSAAGGAVNAATSIVGGAIDVATDVAGSAVSVATELPGQVISQVTNFLFTRTTTVKHLVELELTTVATCTVADANIPSCAARTRPRFVTFGPTAVVPGFETSPEARAVDFLEPSFDNSLEEAPGRIFGPLPPLGLFTVVTKTQTETVVTATVNHPSNTVTISVAGCRPGALGFSAPACMP